MSSSRTRSSVSKSGRTAEPKWYGAPRPAERDPAIGRALAVDDQVAGVVEGRAVVEPDRGPRLVGSGSVATIIE